jgi:REP element-mobilizing transposase RayT
VRQPDDEAREGGRHPLKNAMAKSYTNLLYHFVFATKNRQPLIVGAAQTQLYDYLGGTVRRLGGVSLGVNGTADHVHLLAKLRPDRAVSDVLRDVKANASGWLHEVFPDLKDFSWQNGYGAFTVSFSQVERCENTSHGRKSITANNRFEMNSWPCYGPTKSNLTNDICGSKRTPGAGCRPFHGLASRVARLTPRSRTGLYDAAVFNG